MVYDKRKKRKTPDDPSPAGGALVGSSIQNGENAETRFDLGITLV